MRVNYRKAPGGGAQRHAKLGKRPGLKGSAAADAAIEKSKRVLKPDKEMKPPKKASESSLVDDVKHKTKTNKSGYKENVTG